MSGRKSESKGLFIMVCVALVTIIVILIIALALTLRTGQEGNAAPDNTTLPKTTSTAPVSEGTTAGTEKTTTAPVTTTEPVTTTKPAVEPPVTTTTTTTTKPPVVTTESTTTTKKPVVEPETDIVKSGSFYSDNKEKIKLYVEWESVKKPGEDTASVSLKIYIQSYSLHVGHRSDGVIILDGKTSAFSSEAIAYDGAPLVKNLVAEKTLSADLTGGDGALELSVSWNFSGTYSGVEIGSIVASETIEVM